jgi:hypothetical protein
MAVSGVVIIGVAATSILLVSALAVLVLGRLTRDPRLRILWPARLLRLLRL